MEAAEQRRLELQLEARRIEGFEEEEDDDDEDEDGEGALIFVGSRLGLGVVQPGARILSWKAGDGDTEGAQTKTLEDGVLSKAAQTPKVAIDRENEERH